MNSLSTYELTYEEAKDRANIIISDKKFSFFILIISVTLAGIFYSIDNYKNYSFQIL